MTQQPAPDKVEKPCHVAGHGCYNPVGWRSLYGRIAGNPTLTVIPLCFRCGDPVCEGENCSSVVEYEGEERRLCTTCLDEMAREKAI